MGDLTAAAASAGGQLKPEVEMLNAELSFNNQADATKRGE